MPAIYSSPEVFEIEAATPEACDLQHESHIIRMRLEGTYEIRAFLSDHGVNEKQIAFAIEELGHTGARPSALNRGEKARDAFSLGDDTLGTIFRKFKRRPLLRGGTSPA